MPSYKFVNADQLDADLTAVADSIRAKGKTTGALAFPAGFQKAVSNISTGIDVQKKSGTFTTNNSGEVTVVCGFKPDLVLIKGDLYADGEENRVFNGAAAFAEETRAGTQNICMWATDCLLYDIYIVQNNTGFAIEANLVDYDMETTTLTKKTFDYVAVKYS